MYQSGVSIIVCALTRWINHSVCINQSGCITHIVWINHSGCCTQCMYQSLWLIHTLWLIHLVNAHTMIDTPDWYILYDWYIWLIQTLWLIDLIDTYPMLDTPDSYMHYDWYTWLIYTVDILLSVCINQGYQS
jgi:hypothetical protein